MSTTVRSTHCPTCGAPLVPTPGPVTCSYCRTTVTIEASPEGAHLTPVALSSPLWLLPWTNAYKWVWPRVQGEQELVLLPLADPYSDPNRPEYLWLVYAEQLAMQTQLPVRGVVGVSPGVGVVRYIRGALPPYEDTLPSLRQFNPPPLAVLWGEVGADESRESTLRMRAPGTGDPFVEATMRVPSAHAAGAFLDWLVQQGRAARVAPPPWYAPPPPALLGSYCVAVQSMLLFVLAKNKVLPVPPSLFAHGIELAYGLAAQPGAPPQCRFFPLTMTLLAAQVGVLADAQRRRALQIATAARDPRDILTWLSPHLLRVLGAVDEANARAAAFGAQPGPYQDWIRSLAAT